MLEKTKVIETQQKLRKNQWEEGKIRNNEDKTLRQLDSGFIQMTCEAKDTFKDTMQRGLKWMGVDSEPSTLQNRTRQS